MIRLKVPASKSITQRALVLAALSDEMTEISNPLDCDDSRALIGGLKQLGTEIEREPGFWRVKPTSFLAANNDTLFLGNAGTAVRFMTGLSLLIKGSYVIDGNRAMRKRPMPGLLSALRSLGIAIEELGNEGCPPIRLTCGGREQTTPGEKTRVELRAGGSSQELSALLLSGCRLPNGLQIQVRGTLPSMPYVAMTRDVMDSFGVRMDMTSPGVFRVRPAIPRAQRFVVETDWSSASYPLAASWLTRKPVEIENLNRDSIQGDRDFPYFLEKLSEKGPRVLSMGDTPDLVPGIVACALFADGITEIVDAAHLRIKESNRIEDLAGELSKIGAIVEPRPDGMIITPSEIKGDASLDPHDDHRLAMAFGLVSLKVPSIEIMNKNCVRKSYPDFWGMLEVFR